MLLGMIFWEARALFDWAGRSDSSIRLLALPEVVVGSSLVETTCARRYWPFENNFPSSTSSGEFPSASLSFSSAAAISSILLVILSEIDVMGTYPVRLFGKERAMSWSLIWDTWPRTRAPGTSRC